MANYLDLARHCGLRARRNVLYRIQLPAVAASLNTAWVEAWHRVDPALHSGMYPLAYGDILSSTPNSATPVHHQTEEAITQFWRT